LVFEFEEVKLCTLERPFLLNGWLISTWDFMGLAVEQLRYSQVGDRCYNSVFLLQTVHLQLFPIIKLIPEVGRIE
jgi:hypothetical protein